MYKIYIGNKTKVSSSSSAIMITTITATSPPYDDKRGTIWLLGEYQAQLPP